MLARLRVGLIGARGHVGAELIALLQGHPRFELAFVSSRELAGEALAPSTAGQPAIRYEALDAVAVATRDVDALILALPNGVAAEYLAAIDAREGSRCAPVIVDLSADYRFDDTWFYGLPELARDRYRGQRRIANPGCYATAMQLALWPVRSSLSAPPQCFGVSGYSGAGTSPSPRNDPGSLRDNLMPYALIDHLHEREVTRHLGFPVEFLPHVAPHFRGLTITANLHLREAFTRESLRRLYSEAYADEPLVRVLDEAPWVSRIAGRHHAELGGFMVSAEGRRAVVVATLDNLLKGAATQALQNLNLAFGLPELDGIPVDATA